jgi:dipeptidyl aminopeptidase/acylaminoacyl peptidase
MILVSVLSLVVLMGAWESVQSKEANTDYLSQLPPLVDLELFFGDPEISSSQLSPQGKYITFVKPYNDVRNIYIKRFDEPFDAARPITADERPVLAYFWSQDGKYILYVQDKLGDENWHVYAVDPSADPDPDSGVPPARDLTPIDGITARIYSVPENKPGEMVVGMNDRDEEYHDVYRVDIATGERELLIKNTHKVGGWNYDLEGNVRLATRQLDDGGSEVLRVDGDELVQVYACTFEETCYPTRFHKNGDRTYMVTNKGDESDLTRLVLFDPETGEEELVESDPEGLVDFGGAVFAEDTDDLIATVYVGDRVRIYTKEKKIEKDIERLRERFPDAEFNLQSSTEDMRLHLISVGTDVDPGSLYLYDRKSGDIDLLYRSRPDLPSEHLAPMQAVRYKARDGLEIPAYLTTPSGVEAKDLPTIILPHGGPWARDYWGYDPYSQFLANRGYAVLQMNFRGSTGYGKKFLNAGNREWGTGAMQHDITDGVNYLIDEGIADPDRVGIFGGSYGGYAALAGITFTPDLYAAAIPYVAPSNLVTLLKSIPPYWATFLKIFHKRLGDPDDPEDKADLMARSPLFKAEEIKVPVLLVHGLNDPRVKKVEADMIVVACRERGLDIEFVVAPDEGHGFRAPENRLALAAGIERFLAKHLKGRYQEDVSEEITDKLAELTVDISSVSLPDNTLAAYAETAPLPERSPEVLQEMTIEYSADVEVGGQQIQMEMTREVKGVEFEGTPAWSIATSTQSPMGAAADTIYVDKETLLPLAHSISQGPAVVHMNYTPDAIKGQITMGEQVIPIDVKLNAPVMPDGGGLEVVLAALPLGPDYETTLRVFDVLTQGVRPMSLKVLGKETLDLDFGSFEVYKVRLEPLDGQPDVSTISVSVDAPACVVHIDATLPAATGGGTMKLEATSIQAN